MVKFYDKNMNEVYLPKDTDLHYGSYPLELNISSIEYEKQGQKRVSIGRQASLSAFIIASRETDMKLKIKRVYEFFRLLEEFYVADGDTPYELLKVSVEQTYTIGFGNGALIDFEIPLTVHKPYFKQSLHTTLDIDREGVRWNDKWGYGMGLSSDKREWGYSQSVEKPFNPNLIPLNADRWEDGSRWSSGLPSGSSNGIRMKESLPINVQPGREYTIYDESLASSNIALWRVFELNSDNTLIQRTFLNRNSGSRTFVANSEKVLLAADHSGNSNIEKTFLNDGKIKVKFEEGDRFTGFYPTPEAISFYNAGTEEVKLIQQKESEIKIDIKSSVNWLEIHDGKQTFRLNRAVKSGDTLIIRGHQILLNGNNVAGNSNRVFLTVKKGWNDWEVRGLGNFKFSINFRFLYD